MAKRKRDEEERAAKRKGKRTDEEGNKERHEKEDEQSAGGDSDLIALQKIRMREDLERYVEANLITAYLINLDLNCLVAGLTRIFTIVAKTPSAKNWIGALHKCFCVFLSAESAFIMMD